MKSKSLSMMAGCSLALALFSSSSFAADSKDEVIKDVMKKYHKAPQGQDHIAKKAAMGKASKEEINALVEAYTKMAKAKPSKGDNESWNEKSGKLLAATKAMQKGDANGVTLFKEASNCKACHSVHKPD